MTDQSIIIYLSIHASIRPSIHPSIYLTRSLTKTKVLFPPTIPCNGTLYGIDDTIVNNNEYINN